MNKEREAFQNSLLRWFRRSDRGLPWRKDYNPYHIWLSEIMLQQTQMERGVNYFTRWLRRFPDIVSVARATPYEILKYWEGLGYYARARNLHQAAQIMAREYGGSVPDEYEELIRLPGIGAYTASAIASIAFNRDIPVIDANVERIFSRIFDIDTPLKERKARDRIHKIAADLLPAGQARNFNQALMDLGGLICRSKNPDCGTCPVAEYCQAYRGNFVNDRPIKNKPQKRIDIEMATGMLVKDGHIFIQQRQNNDIWGGLWEFPGGRLEKDETPEAAVIREYLEETAFNIEVCRKVTEIIHFYTKYRVTLHCFFCRMTNKTILPDLQAAQNYHWVMEEQLGNYGFPAGHRKFIEYIRENCPQAMLREC